MAKETRYFDVLRAAGVEQPDGSVAWVSPGDTLIMTGETRDLDLATHHLISTGALKLQWTLPKKGPEKLNFLSITRSLDLGA